MEIISRQLPFRHRETAAVTPLKLIQDLGRCLTDTIHETRAPSFLKQRISVALQVGNVASVLGTNIKGLQLGLQCIKIYRFIQYSPRKCSIILFNQWLMREEIEMETLYQEL